MSFDQNNKKKIKITKLNMIEERKKTIDENINDID